MIFKLSTKNYLFYINLKLCKNIFIITPQASYKYSWSVNYNSTSYFTIMGSFSQNNINIKTNIKLTNYLNSIIELKRKSTMLKKYTDFEYLILNKIHNSTKSKKFYFNNKSFDLKKKKNLVFKKNRTVLKSFLNIKFIRQFNLSKKIRNLIKLGNKPFLLNFEYNIINVISFSNFFFNKKDIIWFFKNSLISLNGFVIKNLKYVLKPFDIINISLNNGYYYYYKNYLNICLNNFYKINLKLWKINKRRSDFLKNVEKCPNWIYNYTFFKHDLPLFLEVDYITMSFILLNYQFKSSYLSYYNLKFLNIYLSRLYNWKFII